MRVGLRVSLDKRGGESISGESISGEAGAVIACQTTTPLLGYLSTTRSISILTVCIRVNCPLRSAVA